MKFNLGPLKNKKNLLTGLTVIAPVIGGGLLLENAYNKNPDEFKKNVSNIHSTIKTDIGDTFKGGSAFDKLMFPLIAIGTIVVLVVIFKK